MKILTSLPIFTIQILGKAVVGDMFGEIGVLCYRPQSLTVRTSELSQILRLSRTSLMNAIQANIEDGHVIMNNLFKVYDKITKVSRAGKCFY